jgi:hypothetical protein
MATPNDGLVDSPFGRVRPEILEILNGGTGSQPSTDNSVPEPVEVPGQQPIGSPAGPQEVSAKEPVEVVEQPQVVDPDSARSIIGRSADQLQAQMYGTVEAIGEATGNQYLMDTGAEGRKEQLEEAAQYGNPSVGSYRDVDLEDPESLGSYIKQLGLGMTPGLAAVGGSAAAGAKVGGMFGIPGRAAGGMVGAFLGSFGINTGAFQNEVKELDPTAKGGWTSLAFGTGAGALDAFGLSKMVSPLLKWVPEDVVYRNALAAGFPPVMAQTAIRQAAVNTAKGAGLEAAIGAAQEGSQAYLAAKVSDHELNLDNAYERMVNAALGGGIVGGAVRGGSSILDTITQNAHAVGSAHQGKTFAEGNTEEGGLLKKAWHMGGSAATEPLIPLARVSPEAEAFVREFRPDMTGEKATGKTVFEDTDIMAGTWNKKLDDVVKSKSDVELAKLIEEASLPKAQLSGEALHLRKILDEVPEVAKREGGLSNVGYIDGFMPFRVDPRKVEANPQGFLADIAPFVQDPVEALRNWQEEINTPKGSTVPEIDQLVKPDSTTGELEIMMRARKAGDPDTMRAKFAQGDVTPKFGHLEFSRSFGSVPQAVLNKWTTEQTPKQRVEAVRDYFEGAAHRISFAKRFGENGEKANAQIAKAVYEAQQKGRPVSKGEIDQMYGLLNAYNGMYGRLKSEAAKNAQSLFSAFLVVKTLPLATLSSLFEFVTPAIRGDVGSALTSLIPTFAEMAKEASRVLLKGVPKSDFAQVASEAGLSFHSAQSVMAERLGATMFNRGAAKATRAFFLVNGLSALTHVNRTYAAKTADSIFHENLFKLASGIDITSAKGAQLANQLRSMGVDIKTNADAKALYNPTNPSEVAAARDARVLAMHRFTRQTVLEPNIADTPLWMSNGKLQLLAMLKRYPSAFSNTILPQLMRKLSPTYQGSYQGALAGAIGITFILGAGLGLGYIQDELKQIAKAGTTEYEDNRTEGMRFADVLNTTLMPMQMQYVSDMFTATRHGTTPVESIMGPAAGFVTETGLAAYKTISSFEENPTSGHIWKYLYEQTPARVFKPGKEAIKEEFDLP